MKEEPYSPSPEQTLLAALDHAAHVLPMQGPIGVFVHHNTLHAFENRPFEQAVLDAGALFGAEPYMTEAAYRAELARGRIRIEDLDAVLDGEPDAVIFPQLTRHSLRRAMMTPGVREYDAATIEWRLEQGDLARDFRRPALRALFDACFHRSVAHEEEPGEPRPVDEVIHPWLIRLCSVFLDQGLAYWPMPNRERGFYQCVRALLSAPAGIFPLYLTRPCAKNWSGTRHLTTPPPMRCSITLHRQCFKEADWQSVLEAELLALPGWAGLMRRLEEDPGLAPHEAVPADIDGLPGRAAHHGSSSLARRRRRGPARRNRHSRARSSAASAAPRAFTMPPASSRYRRMRSPA